MEIFFLLDDIEFRAKVISEGNIYQVFPQDAALMDKFGELVLIEGNQDFAWKDYGSEHYKFALAVALALKAYLF